MMNAFMKKVLLNFKDFNKTFINKENYILLYEKFNKTYSAGINPHL